MNLKLKFHLSLLLHKAKEPVSSGDSSRALRESRMGRWPAGIMSQMTSDLAGEARPHRLETKGRHAGRLALWRRENRRMTMSNDAC